MADQCIASVNERVGEILDSAKARSLPMMTGRELAEYRVDDADEVSQ
jgi:hypothetical protein